MKFLVLGATGMAGHMVAHYLQEQGHEVVGFSHVPLEGLHMSICGDVRRLPVLEGILQVGDFDYVINCIGVLNKNAENDVENAIFINSYFPHWLSKIVKGMKTRLIHLSTDCVFSGKRGKYALSDAPDGISVYDKTKALGEIIDNRNLTFRNSIIGPDMRENGIGLFNWFMKQNEEVDGYTASIWSGVTTLTLAKAIEMAAEKHLTGVYHLTNNQPISKFELLKIVNKYFRDGKIKINKITGICHDKSIINERTDFLFEVPTYEKMIIEMRSWVQIHSDLYPSYLVGGE